MSVARVEMTLEEMGPRLFGLVYLACPLTQELDEIERQWGWCAMVSAASSALAVAPDRLSLHAAGLASELYVPFVPDYTRLRDLMRQRADFVVVPPLGDCARRDLELAEARARCMPVWHLAMPVWHLAEARP